MNFDHRYFDQVSGATLDRGINRVALQFAKRERFQAVYMGVRDKRLVIEHLCSRHKLERHEIACRITSYNVCYTKLLRAWDMNQPGILNIVVRGGRCFRVERTYVRPDQLLVGEVEFQPEEPTATLPIAHDDLGELLARILEQLGEQYYFPPVQLADAGWVAHRLTELLPLPSDLKQQVLEQPRAEHRITSYNVCYTKLLRA